jgi:hypothetical protein
MYRRQLLFLRGTSRLQAARSEDRESSIALASGARERIKRSIRDVLDKPE